MRLADETEGLLAGSVLPALLVDGCLGSTLRWMLIPTAGEAQTGVPPPTQEQYMARRKAMLAAGRVKKTTDLNPMKPVPGKPWRREFRGYKQLAAMKWHGFTKPLTQMEAAKAITLEANPYLCQGRMTQTRSAPKGAVVLYGPLQGKGAGPKRIRLALATVTARYSVTHGRAATLVAGDCVMSLKEAVWVLGLVEHPAETMRQALVAQKKTIKVNKPGRFARPDEPPSLPYVLKQVPAHDVDAMKRLPLEHGAAVRRIKILVAKYGKQCAEKAKVKADARRKRLAEYNEAKRVREFNERRERGLRELLHAVRPIDTAYEYISSMDPTLLMETVILHPEIKVVDWRGVEYTPLEWLVERRPHAKQHA
jgi:hypothetical protein